MILACTFTVSNEYEIVVNKASAFEAYWSRKVAHDLQQLFNHGNL